MIGGFNLVGFDNFIEDLEQMPASITAKDVDYTQLFKDCIVNEAIDAQKLQDGIFPVNENYDIFISHSHNDEKLAIKLKNWIEARLGMTCFLDKEIWGSGDKILSQIDRLCWKPDRKVYDYNERNLTTSYVHVMLCNALMQAMDNYKFVFFLTTPSSITPESAHDSPQTHSTWLFYELSVLKYIQKEPGRIRKSFSRGRESLQEDIQNIMNYPAVDLTALPELTFADLVDLSNLDEGVCFETLLNRLGV